jgi:drug/metabolite transporter (DMT)-like permease
MQLIGILCSTAAALFWAMAVIMFKKSGDILSPTALNLYKGIVTLVLLMPTLWVAGIPMFPRCSLSDWLMFGASGIIGITLADNFFLMALKRLGAGLWAVVECLYLPFIIFSSALYLNEAIGIKGIIGATLVAAAVVAGSYSGDSLPCSRRDLTAGLFFGVLSVTLLAGSIVMIKPLLERTDILWASFVRLVAGVAGLLVITAIHPQRCMILGELKPSPAWKTALPGSIVGNYLAMLAWLAGFKYTLVSVAAILNQLSTIFTFILAAFFLKEPVTLTRTIAIGLAVIGALLASTAV